MRKFGRERKELIIGGALLDGAGWRIRCHLWLDFSRSGQSRLRPGSVAINGRGPDRLQENLLG
jgi:hypothetical protein